MAAPASGYPMPYRVEIYRVLPELILSVFGTLVMVLDPLTKKKDQRLLGMIALTATYSAAIAALLSYALSGTAFSGMIVVDGFATFFRLLVCVIGFLIVLA